MKLYLTQKGVISLLQMLDPGEQFTVRLGKTEGVYEVDFIPASDNYTPVFDFDDDEIAIAEKCG